MIVPCATCNGTGVSTSGTSAARPRWTGGGSRRGAVVRSDHPSKLTASGLGRVALTTACTRSCRCRPNSTDPGPFAVANPSASRVPTGRAGPPSLVYLHGRRRRGVRHALAGHRPDEHAGLSSPTPSRAGRSAARQHIASRSPARDVGGVLVHCAGGCDHYRRRRAPAAGATPASQPEAIAADYLRSRDRVRAHGSGYIETADRALADAGRRPRARSRPSCWMASTPRAVVRSGGLTDTRDRRSPGPAAVTACRHRPAARQRRSSAPGP